MAYNEAGNKDYVSMVVDRKKEWENHFDKNYGDQIEEVGRAVKCLVNPIYKKDSAGNDTSEEDDSRTNVCMPELSLIRRKKVARYTANPPQYKYTAQDDGLAERLSQLALQQIDRSGEMIERRRLIDMGVTFGWAPSKIFFDSVVMDRPVWRDIAGNEANGIAPYAQRGPILGAMGAPPDEIQAQVQELGQQMQPEELAGAIQKLGSSRIKVKEQLKKYEGAVFKSLWMGDVFGEPNKRSMAEWDWTIEQSYQNDLWLQKQVKLGFIEPDAAQELIDSTSNLGEQKDLERLKTRLRAAYMHDDTKVPTRLLPKKTFLIYEQHCVNEEGELEICYVGNEKIKLGKRPYPWDFYGKTCYQDFVPLPDFIEAVGDSTPRLMRFLHNLHNAGVGMRKDFLRNVLNPLLKLSLTEDVPDEIIDRIGFRIMRMADPRQGLWEQMPPVPPAAFEEEGQELRMLAWGEPALNQTDTGSESNPMAGKLATTAIIAKRVDDALSNFEMNGLAAHDKEVGEKKLWIWQQQEGADSYQLEPKFVNKALSDRYGKTAVITVEQDEIQEDIRVEPVEGSVLAVDDDLQKQKAMELMQFAAQNPDIIDRRYAAEVYLGTMRGVDSQKALLPPPQPKPPIEKINFSITSKITELPASIQQYFYSQLPGAPQMTPPEVVTKGMADTLEHLNRAGAAVEELDSTPEQKIQHAAMESQAKKVDKQAAQ